MDASFPDDLQSLFGRFGIALALGLLVGIQRERSGSRLAGLRTFPLVTLFGALSALLAPTFGAWLPAAGLLALAATLGVANLVARGQSDHSPGITTEVAALLMFLVGAALVAGWTQPAIVLGGGVSVLLHFKQQLHGFAARLSENDIVAFARFVLVALVILPVLPDQHYGPFAVLNPYEIWWMVVLIVGIGLLSFVGWRLWGAKAGTLLAGVLGGLISSTATTASYARRTRESPQASALGAVVVLIASTVLYARVLVEIVAVAPRSASALAPPVAVLLAVFVVLCALAWVWRGEEAAHVPAPEDPAELRPALVFALAYAAILFAVAAARHYFPGDQALYAVAVVSGLTDVDAITLSTATLVENGKLEAGTGWRLVVLASLSNLAFKAGIVAVVGDRGLLRRVLVWFGLGAAAAAALLLLWP